MSLTLPPAAQTRETVKQMELNALLVAKRAATEATRAYQQQQAPTLTAPMPGMGMGMSAPAAPTGLPIPGALSALTPPTPAGMTVGMGGPSLGALSAPTGLPQPPPPSAPLPPVGSGGMGMGAGAAGVAGAAPALPAPSPPPLTPFAEGGMVKDPPVLPPGATAGPTDPRSLKAQAPVSLLPGVLSAEQILDAIGRALAGEPVDTAAYNDVPGAGAAIGGPDPEYGGDSPAMPRPTPSAAPASEDTDAQAFVAALKENPPQAPRRFERWLVEASPQTEFETDVQQTFAQNADSGGLLYGVVRAALEEDGLLGPELARLVGGGKAKKVLEPIEGEVLRAPTPRGRQAA